MSDPGKYRTARSVEEVLEVFRLEGMSESDIESFRQRLSRSTPEPPPKSEFDDVDEIYERICSLCGGACFITAAMQAICPPESPFNVCKGCYNRLAVQDEELSKAELKDVFRDYRDWL